MKNVGVRHSGNRDFSRYGAHPSGPRVRNAIKNILPHFPECRTVHNNPGIYPVATFKRIKVIQLIHY